MTRIIPILLLAIICASCKTEQQHVKIRRAPVPVALADIPQRSVARAVQSPQSVVPAQPRPMRLSWDYPADRLWEIKGFRVYSNTALTRLPWPLFAETEKQFIDFFPTNTARFFVCTAVAVSGLESDYNTK